jgi:hypothetical protein
MGTVTDANGDVIPNATVVLKVDNDPIRRDNREQDVQFHDDTGITYQLSHRRQRRRLDVYADLPQSTSSKL